MRYIACLAMLLATLPASADPTILADLTAQLQHTNALPAFVIQAVPARLKIVSLPTGALARWNPKTDTFEVSKSIWKHAPHQFSCLLPLFVHETLHAYFYKTARSQGFAWPITLQDEVLAHYYQLKTEQTLPNYEDTCSAWRAQLTAERAAFTQQNWPAFEEAIFTRYSQGIARHVKGIDASKLQRPGQRDGDAATARTDVEHRASRGDILLHEPHQLLRLGPRNKHARTDQKLVSTELGTAQNILHRFASCHSFNNNLQFGFVLCR